MSIKIHIYLILLSAYMFSIGKLETFIYYYLFVFMHELAHILVALVLKVDIKEIELLPIGMNAKYENNISKYKELFISLAGPLASFLFSICFKNATFAQINLSIAFLNLVPIYPFDGGRILRCFLKIIFGDFKGTKISNMITKCFLMTFIIISLLLAAYFKNYYFIIFTIYIFYISHEEIKKEKFYGILNYFIDEVK